MKWFKHMSAAHTDDKLVVIRERFGMWGVGCYWTLIEMVAQQMKGVNPKPFAVFNVVVLCSFFECKRNKLVSFLKHLRNQTGMNVKQNGNIIEIEVPKLLGIKDNYLKDLEETSQSLPSKEVEGDTEEEVEEEERYTSILAHWNSVAKQHSLPAVLRLSDKRQRAVDARLKEGDFDFDKIVEEIGRSDFLRGSTGWRVDFDFVFCSANNYLKILEGKYRNGSSKPSVRPDSQIARATFTHGDAEKQRLAALEEKLSRRDAERDKRP